MSIATHSSPYLPLFMLMCHRLLSPFPQLRLSPASQIYSLTGCHLQLACPRSAALYLLSLLTATSSIRIQSCRAHPLRLPRHHRNASLSDSQVLVTALPESSLGKKASPCSLASESHLPPQPTSDHAVPLSPPLSGQKATAQCIQPTQF